MPERVRQTRRVTLTRGLTRTVKWRFRKGLSLCCESATLIPVPMRVGKHHLILIPYTYARTRMRKGLKHESQSRRVARTRPRWPRGAPRWVEGPLTPQDEPAYVSAAPLAPGGVCARLGPTRGPRTDRVCNDKEVVP